tara:strand:- start:252 stop:632 length:381 start_codon:yes stop_codon:yes gene_type:complete
MVTVIAMQIVGAICVVIGIVMNLDPVGFNERIFGKVDKKAVNQLAALRLPIGGSTMAVGIINLYCSLTITSGDALKSILLATAIGFIVIGATVISGKVRGFSDDIPPLPIVVLSVMTAICLYASLF